MINLVLVAYTSSDIHPVPYVVPFMHDWKHFFDLLLLPLQEHSGPHVFLFTQDASTKVVMFYKDYHFNINNLHGGDGDRGLTVLSALLVRTPALLPRKLLPADCEKILKLFSMLSFPQKA